MKLKINNLSLSLLLIGVLTTLTACQKKETLQTAFNFSNDLFQEGDIVFRRGTGLISESVLTIDRNGVYSHTGIVVKDKGEWKIIHAVPGEPDFKGDKDRIKIESVESFFNHKKAITGAVMRVNKDSASTQMAARYAMEIYNRTTLFDHDYDLADTTKMYCTELVNFVFTKAGVDLLKGKTSLINIPGLKGEYILPSDIQQSKELSFIYSF